MESPFRSEGNGEKNRGNQNSHCHQRHWFELGRTNPNEQK